MKHENIKKHFSVFMLMARSTIYKFLFLLFVMAIIEVILFCLVLSRGPVNDVFAFEIIMDESKLQWIFGIFFLLVTALLCMTGYETSSKQRYTLMRLSISERWIFAWQSLYNCICYASLWLFQTLLVIVFSYLYLAEAGSEYVTVQTIFIAFYRNNFLHSLLPFDENLFWIRNIVFVLALGICAARFPYAQRHDDRKIEIIALACGVLFYFIRETGDFESCNIALVFSVIGIIVSIYRVLRRRECNEN